MYRINFPASYGKCMNGILGAGSLAYATYFDGDPAWVYAIQMVPQNHWNNYLVREKARGFYQWTNLWNDRLLNLHSYALWTNTGTYNNGQWIQCTNCVWSGNTNAAGWNQTNIPPGSPAPGQANAPWTKQRDMTTGTANDLGNYTGNYILGWEALFNPDDVAALMNNPNAAVCLSRTYSGVSYYLAHAMRRLGDQDPNFYTSLPTSQIYYNTNTGARTVITFNPSATPLKVNVYSNGVAVGTVTAGTGLTLHANPVPGTFEPSVSPTLLVSWSTAVNNNYNVQWAAPTNGTTWNDLTGITAGDGTTNSLFDPLGAGGARNYRVLEYTSYVVTNVANGGFELGTGTTAANWTGSGTYSNTPIRISTNVHSGTWAMKLGNYKSANGGVSVQQDESTQGAPAIVPGLTNNFSFWAQQILSGSGLVQNYNITWLTSANATISPKGATSFRGGSGTWTQITASGLVAPANAVNARINFSSTTGANTNWMTIAGEVLLDDVLLTTSAPGSTNVMPATIQTGWAVSWPTAN